MLVLLAHTAFSAVVGLMMADLFKRKEGEPQPEVQGMPTAQQALARAHIKAMVAGYDAPHGHLVPDDAAEMERVLWEIADLYPGTEGFPAITSIAGERKNTMSQYDLVGADLMFGADQDVLEALTVNGDMSSLVGGDGSSEIVGADLIGAAMNGNPRAKAALRHIAMRNAGAVIKNDLKNRRRYPLGFVPTTVDAGDSATIPAAPQNLFRPERLVIPSDIAFDFGVSDVKVGNQSQFAQSVEVPAAVFTEVSIDTNVTFDTAEVGNQISILVRNKGTTDNLEFTAAAIGTIAKA